MHLFVDTEPLNQPISNTTRLIPFQANVPTSQYTVDHSCDKSVKTLAPDAILSQTSLHRPMTDINSSEAHPLSPLALQIVYMHMSYNTPYAAKSVASHHSPRTPSSQRRFRSPTRDMLTTPIRSVACPRAPIHTPLSASRHLPRHQHNFVISASGSYPQLPAFLPPSSRRIITPYTSEGFACQIPDLFSTSSEFHRSRQHDTSHTSALTNLPISSSPSPSPGRPQTQRAQSISRPLTFSKQDRIVSAYASLKDSEEWSTLPPRKKQKISPPDITTTRKFMLPIAIPSKKANITSMKRTVTMYKPPPAHRSGSQSPIILNPRRVGRREGEIFRRVRITGGAGSDSSKVDKLDKPEEKLKDPALVPNSDLRIRPSESSPPTSPPSSPSPNVVFLLPEIQRTYPATRKAISEVKNWKLVIHFLDMISFAPSSARVPLSRALGCST